MSLAAWIVTGACAALLLVMLAWSVTQGRIDQRKQPNARPSEPDPHVQDVIRNALVSVPPQPWESYIARVSYAAAGALTDLGLAAPLRPIRRGVLGWWDRLRCNHVWRAHGFADWRCPRCGKFR